MKLKNMLVSIARTLLGVVFVFSGAVKAIDPFGTVYKIEDYLKAFGGLFTELLPLAEVAAIFTMVNTRRLMDIKASAAPANMSRSQEI